MDQTDLIDEYGFIDEFLNFIWLEKNLSKNTLDAYRRDLTKTERWLRRNTKSLITASSIDLHQYLE